MAEQETQFIIFAGHSLGGTAAFCLASQYTNSRSVSLNGGAAASNPVMSGPGPGKATFYHVFGDLVSTHMSPDAAKIIRIKKNDSDFSVLYPHSSARILKSDGPWRYASADEEDLAWQQYGSSRHGSVGGSIIGKIIRFVDYIKNGFTAINPIPGSKRWLDR